MQQDKTALERAFELARSGQCANKTEILKALRQEGFGDVTGQLEGKLITAQLSKLCRAARSAANS